MTALMSRPIDATAKPAAVQSEPDAPDAFDADGFAAELDAIRAEILASLGQADADHITSLIRNQRRLELTGRALLMAGVFPPAWLAGVAALGLAKILENMEIGHNVMHAQWDWMRDPEIHSTTWEWDNVCPSTQWKHSHNYLHHQWTNVRGMDNDIGYGVLRVDPEEPWQRHHLFQPAYFVALALLFEYGVGFHDLEGDIERGEPLELAKIMPKLRETLSKIGRQVTKDYVAWPALALPLGVPSVVASVAGAAAANVIRNVWSFSVIFCGHFPEGVEIFDHDPERPESKGEWYRRQAAGSANFTGGPIMDLMSGNLDHQIEHHLFPDLPSHRYAEIAPRVQEICERHGVGYRSASFGRQFGSVIRKVARLSLPWN